MCSGESVVLVRRHIFLELNFYDFYGNTTRLVYFWCTYVYQGSDFACISRSKAKQSKANFAVTSIFQKQSKAKLDFQNLKAKQSKAKFFGKIFRGFRPPIYEL